MQLPPNVRRALAFNPAGLAPGAAIRSALGVVTPMVIGSAAGHPADGALAAVGALPVGVAAMSGDVPVAPLGLLASTSVGMAVSTFVGSLVSGHPVLLVLALGAWGYLAGLLVVLGRNATIVGVQAVIGLLVLGRYPGGPWTALAHAGAVLAGGGIQIVFAVLLRPPRRFAPERQVLADLYQRLAALAAGTAYGGPSGAAITSAGVVLARRAPDHDTLRDLLDVGRRVRLELQALRTVPDLPGVEDVTGAAAGDLRKIARAIQAGAAPAPAGPDLEAAVEAIRRHRVPRGRAGARSRFANARAGALLGQLRAADRLVRALAGERRVPLPRVAGVGSALPMRSELAAAVSRLRETATDPRAPAWRHGVRLATVMVVAELIGRALPWQRGYWVPLTAAVVLKPDYAATFQRGIGRIVGTGLGVVLAGLLVREVHPAGGGLVIAVGVAAWASYAMFAASFAVYTFLLTFLVVLLISTGDPRLLSAVADRGLDTAIGGALALVAFAAWPTREEATLRASLARMLAAVADYAGTVFVGYVEGRFDADVDRRRASAAARDARRARSDAEASLERALSEPSRLRPETETALSVLAGARRIVIALHALRATLEDTREHQALPELATTATDVVAALDALSVAVETGATPEVDGLRAAQHELEELADADAESLHGRRLAVVAAHLDPVVDAIDTIAHVLEK